MGGSVGVIIKKEDGTQIAMNRWTNVMPYFFNDSKLYTNQLVEWYDEFSKEWLVMKKDYEDNKDTENFRENMTSCYFPHTTASPCEYGIIVADFKTKTIYSSQDYTNIASLCLGRADMESVQTFFKLGMFKDITFYDRHIQKEVSIDISSLSLKKLSHLIKEISVCSRERIPFSDPLLSNYLPDDLSPWMCHMNIHSEWKIIHYNNRDVGILKIKKELDRNGFHFTEEDNNEWKNFLSYRWNHCSPNELKKDLTYQEFSDLYKEVFNEQFVPMKNNKIKI